MWKPSGSRFATKPYPCLTWPRPCAWSPFPICDGDTHGGQIAVPLYGALLSIGRRGREFTSGLYHVGKATVVVTPGIGVERGFPFRFLVPPEITVLDLVPAAGK
jgi:hypothetical protein